MIPEGPPGISHDELLAGVALMRRFPGRWCVSGGWALDLLPGAPSREHGDLEFGITRVDQGLLHDFLPGWSLHAVEFREEGNLWRPWPREERLELPSFQVMVRREGATPPEFEFFLNDIADDAWLYRYEPSIRRPLDRMIVTSPDGIPLMAPELVLLHKARHQREKDEHDFRRVLPLMDAEQRAWLAGVLEQRRPGHPWIDLLRP